MSTALHDKMKSAPIGWLAVDNAWDLLNFDLTTKDTAERFQPGTLNNLGIYAFNSSMKLFKEFGFDEIEKQISIQAAVAYALKDNHKINMIDTPGYANFIWEAKVSLRAVETAAPI